MIVASDARILVWFVLPAIVWVDCPMCWAAGRILAEGAYRPCAWCLGVGQVPR